jgi:hypothetical protein
MRLCLRSWRSVAQSAGMNIKILFILFIHVYVHLYTYYRYLKTAKKHHYQVINIKGDVTEALFEVYGNVIRPLVVQHRIKMGYTKMHNSKYNINILLTINIVSMIVYKCIIVSIILIYY